MVVSQHTDIDWHSLANTTITPDLPHVAGQLLLDSSAAVMSQSQRLAAIAVAERTIAAITAAQAELIAAVADSERASLAAHDAVHPPRPGESTPDPERELVALALRISPQTATAKVHHALVIRDRLPLLLSELRAGRISPAAARAIVDETSLCEANEARVVAERVLPMARECAPGQVRRRCRHLATRINPTNTAQRHSAALALRRISVQPEGDGMASLWWQADAATVGRVWNLIDSHARTDKHREARHRHGIDAARCDAAAELLLTPERLDREPITGEPRRRGESISTRPVIAVHVTLSTLLGADDNPAEVPHLGHIPAHAARELAVDCDWLAHLHHTTGQLTHVATRRYTPTPAMVALIASRYPTCAFPLCQQPSHRCDLDHITAYNHSHVEAGGATHPHNLQPLCRRHHNLKTSGQWRVLRSTIGANDDEPDVSDVTTWIGPHHTRATSGVHADLDPDPPW